MLQPDVRFAIRTSAALCAPRIVCHVPSSFRCYVGSCRDTRFPSFPRECAPLHCAPVVIFVPADSFSPLAVVSFLYLVPVPFCRCRLLSSDRRSILSRHECGRCRHTDAVCVGGGCETLVSSDEYLRLRPPIAELPRGDRAVFRRRVVCRSGIGRCRRRRSRGCGASAAWVDYRVRCRSETPECLRLGPPFPYAA